MRKDVIRLSRRRRQRVHIIERDIAGRTVRDASCSASREDALAPMTVLTRSRPGGHHERHPLARNLNGPAYAKGHTRNIPRCTRFTPTTPRVISDTPGYKPSPGVLQAPQGCCKPPRGVASPPRGVASTPRGVTEAPPSTNHPRVRVRHYPGVAHCQDARATISATR